MSLRLYSMLIMLMIVARSALPTNAQDIDPPIPNTAPAQADQGTPIASPPPLFAIAGTAVPVSAITASTTPPDAVDILVSTPQSTATLTMTLEEDQSWSVTIPEQMVTPALNQYQLVAHYGTTAVSSPGYRIEVFESIPLVTTASGILSPEVLLRGGWGDGVDQFGRRGGDESPLEIPPSFAIDEQRDRVYILDTINARIQVFDLTGSWRGSMALPSDTPTDLVVDPATGTLYVFDPLQDAVYTLVPQTTTTTTAATVTHAALDPVQLLAEPLNSPLAYDPATGTLYMSQFAQGTYLPVLHDGTVVSRANITADMRAGQPTLVGDVAAEVDGTTVIIGFNAPDRAAARIVFDAVVLDVADIVVDQGATIWALVGLYHPEKSDDVVETVLLHFNPTTGKAEMSSVSATPPGEVTRRLAPLGHSVVLLEGDDQELRLMRLDLVVTGSTQPLQHVYLPFLANSEVTAFESIAADTNTFALPASDGNTSEATNVLPDDTIDTFASPSDTSTGEAEEMPGLTTAAAQYNPRWTRKQAEAYAIRGLGERYVRGGTTFRDNNRWDADEGIDCSAYVAKVWAVPHYVDPMTPYRAYTTWNFYYQEIYWKHVDRLHPTWMSAFVYQAAAGGKGSHTGLFVAQATAGTWKTYEAMLPTKGVRVGLRKLSDLLSRNYRRIDRNDWGNEQAQSASPSFTGKWYLSNKNAQNGVNAQFSWGSVGWTPVVGDWNGDGIDTPGLFKDGVWKLSNKNARNGVNSQFGWGTAGWTPVVGDWNGDGIDTPGLFKDGVWKLSDKNEPNGVNYQFTWGTGGWTPVVGDWNGDGIDTPGLFKDGVWKLSDKNGPNGVNYQFGWGRANDIPITGDWNKDGITTVGITR